MTLISESVDLTVSSCMPSSCQAGGYLPVYITWRMVWDQDKIQRSGELHMPIPCHHSSDPDTRLKPASTSLSLFHFLPLSKCQLNDRIRNDLKVSYERLCEQLFSPPFPHTFKHNLKGSKWVSNSGRLASVLVTVVFHNNRIAYSR